MPIFKSVTSKLNLLSIARTKAKIIDTASSIRITLTVTVMYNLLIYLQNYFFQMSPDEIKSTYDSFRSSHGRKLNAFYQLRSLFAPLIEGLILLDRLTFLLENGQEAHLVKLFDAYISPRCYALIAIKKRSP